MNSIHTKLLKILEDLILCIEGEWFIGDGALLGYRREGKLIEYDDDIDIYLLPGSKINTNKLKECNLSYQDYYFCGKVYDENNIKQKKNKWWEYVDYIRNQEKNKSKNRYKLYALAKETYKESCIEHTFTYPYIDIYYLEELNDREYILPVYYANIHSCNYFKTPKEWCTTNKVNFCGVENVKIPNNIDDILYLLYGKNWKIPTKERNYHITYSSSLPSLK